MSSWDTNSWSNFCDPHWDLICCNKWHQGTSEISTPLEIAVRMHFYAQTWHWNYPNIFTCWWRSLLVATSKLSLLTIRRHSATRKHLFPYPQGDRSGINIFFSFSMPCYAVFDKELNRNVVCYIRKGCNIYKQSFFCSKICIAISVSA